MLLVFAKGCLEYDKTKALANYLGKTLSKEYFQPVGDLDILTLYSLSFEEFVDGFGKRKLLDSLDLFGGSPHEAYDEAKSYYDTYCQIGGYPSVVKKYIETGSVADAQNEIARIVQNRRIGTLFQRGCGDECF